MVRALFFTLAILPLFFTHPAFARNYDYRIGDPFSAAYGKLTVGNYDEKIEAVQFLRDKCSNEQAISLVLQALSYYYEDKNFRSNDEKSYNNDRIAEELINILGMSRTPRAFGVYLHVVMNPYLHRQETVRAAWKAMMEIDWK